MERLSELILYGIKTKIQDLYTESKIDTANCAETAIAKLKQSPVEVLISDISMKGIDGIELCKHVKNQYSRIKVIVITQHKKIWILKQLYALGVDAILLKEDNLNELEYAIEAAWKNERYFTRSINELLLSHLVHQTQFSSHQIELTEREKSIIDLIASQYTTKEIASKLHIGEKTVETHRKNLLFKFEVRNMVGLIKRAMEMGLIE